MKNNVQKTGGKNSATTAGKYMVVCEGNMKESFLSSGVQFGEDFVMMENDYDMTRNQLRVAIESRKEVKVKVVK